MKMPHGNDRLLPLKTGLSEETLFGGGSSGLDEVIFKKLVPIIMVVDAMR